MPELIYCTASYDNNNYSRNNNNNKGTSPKKESVECFSLTTMLIKDASFGPSNSLSLLLDVPHCSNQNPVFPHNQTPLLLLLFPFSHSKLKARFLRKSAFEMFPTYLTRIDSHFRIAPEDRPYDIPDEVEQAKSSKDVRTLVPLSREGIQYLSKFYPPVKNAADLDELPKQLKGENEFGFSPLFDPRLVDECCQRGIFPLTQDIGEGYYIFTPKIHRMRAVCALVASPAERNTISGFPFCDGDEGIFSRKCVGLSRKLLKNPDLPTKRPSFEVFINRPEDLVGVFLLIRKQHGENWLCKPLRMCLYHMFFNPEKYSTKVIITAIRRKKYSVGAIEKDTREIQEGELVAGEVGFLVGDIYSSATGAYCISGGGALQLCLTGLCMQAAGCRLWDLGMLMDYKKSLNCVEVPRIKWLKLVALRRSNSTAGIQNYLKGVMAGRNVNYFLCRTTSADTPAPNSKSQRKKQQKAEALAEQKKVSEPNR